MTSAERTDRESVRLPRPVGALEDPRLALEPTAARLLDVVSTRGEDVEDEASAGLEQCAGRAQRTKLLGFGFHVEQ